MRGSQATIQAERLRDGFPRYRRRALGADHVMLDLLWKIRLSTLEAYLYCIQAGRRAEAPPTVVNSTVLHEFWQASDIDLAL